MLKKLGCGCMAVPIVLFWTASDPHGIASFQDKAIDLIWKFVATALVSLPVQAL